MMNVGEDNKERELSVYETLVIITLKKVKYHTFVVYYKEH